MPLEVLVAGAMLASLTLYVLSAGADFGGGVWDLLATGRRAEAQRQLIARAIAPIWEANHVWLIIVVVLLFVAFPTAYAAASIALHIPLSLMLVGIVLRGSSFVFRAYGSATAGTRRRWSLIFAVASTVTPVMLGMAVGAIASGTIRADAASGAVSSGFFASWLAAFPLAIGLLALSLFAFLGAVYLTLEAGEPELQDDFRRRALAAAGAVGLLALLAGLLARSDAPLIWQGLTGQWWSLPLHLATGGAAIGAIWCLWQRQFRLARILAICQASLILWGWGIAQFPYLIVPDLTITNTAAPHKVLELLLAALATGAIVLAPSFWYLYAVFKGLGVDIAGTERR